MALRNVQFRATCSACDRDVPVDLSGHIYSLGTSCESCGAVFTSSEPGRTPTQRIIFSTRPSPFPRTHDPGDTYTEKFDEARYHLETLRSERLNPDPWPTKYAVSAYLGAARCIPLYARNEARISGHEGAVKTLELQSDVRAWFADLRTEEVHLSSVPVPSRGIGPHAVHIRTVYEGEVSEPARLTVNTVSYRFDGWPAKAAGQGEVVDSCELYLRELRGLLDECRAKGFIPP